MKPTSTAPATLYVGMDVHKKTWNIHTRTDLFIGKSFSIPSEPEILKKYVDKHYPNYKVICAYESGCFGFAPARIMMSYGWEVLVVNPLDIPKPAKQSFRKTDKVDSDNICKQLKNGQLHSIYIPPVEQEQLRALFRRRFELAKQLRVVKNRIKKQLLYFGYKIPEEFDNANWSKKFITWLTKLSWNYSTGQQSLLSRIEEYHFIYRQILEVSIRLRAYCRKHYKKDYLLKSIPGIGGITAAGIIAELGDLRRFNSYKTLSGYVGIVPGIYQSGDNFKTFGVTPRAKSIVRSYLIEAAWVAVRFDPALQEYYRSHQGKDPRKIIVKVAHKLLCKLYAVIKYETPYQIGIK